MIVNFSHVGSRSERCATLAAALEPARMPMPTLAVTVADGHA
jgi:hypothetical protein